MHRTLISWEVVQQWANYNKKQNKLGMPVPRANNDGALQYFAILSFIQLINVEPLMLSESSENYSLATARFRARMGALMLEAGTNGEAFANLDLRLNLPALEPLVADPIPTAFAIDEDHGNLAENGVVCTQEGDTVGHAEEGTGITPTVEQLALTNSSTPPRSHGGSPNKRAHEDKTTRAERRVKRGGIGRGRGRRGGTSS